MEWGWNVIIPWIVVIVVFLVIWWISTRAFGKDGWYSQIENSSYMPPMWAFFLIWIIAFIFIGYTWSTCYSTVVRNSFPGAIAESIGLAFVIFLLLMILWAWLFFGCANFLGAFTVNLILIFVSLGIVGSLSGVGHSIGVVLMTLVSIWLIIAAFLSYGITKRNHVMDRCDTYDPDIRDFTINGNEKTLVVT